MQCVRREQRYTDHNYKFFCPTIVVDWTTRKRLTDALQSIFSFGRDCNGSRILLLKTVVHLHHPFMIYRLNDLIGFHYSHGRMALRFTIPTHQIIIITEHERIIELAKELGIYGYVDTYFKPSFTEYLSPAQFDPISLDLSCLSSLVLEKCQLQTLPIGNSLISYINLSGSVLGTTSETKEKFWDWMAADTIRDTLTILVMNSCDLIKLPFEILHLSKLKTLSVAKNKLTNIPYYIGELPNLDSLFVNGNQLKYLPGCLLDLSFKSLNVAGNMFDEFSPSLLTLTERQAIRKNGSPVCIKLMYLALFSLIENRSFVRERLPRTLLPLFDQICRCEFCNRLMLSTWSISTSKKCFAKSQNIIKDICIPFEFFECPYICSSVHNYLDFQFHTF